MTLRDPELTLCRDILATMLGSFSERFRNEEANEVLGPLARCANRLHDLNPPRDEIALLIRTIVFYATFRIIRRQLTWGDLEPLVDAYDAALRFRPDESPLLGYMPDPVRERPRRATYSPPGPLVPYDGVIAQPAALKESIESETAVLREEAAAERLEEPDEEALAATTPDAEAPPNEDPPVAGEIYDPARQEPPPVRLETSKAERIPLFRYRALVAEQALDTFALISRHRLLRTMTEAEEEELRMWRLLDAAVQTGPDLIENTERWWAENLSSPDEWKVWAPCFVIGSLEDEKSALALDRILSDLDPEVPAQVTVAAQALQLARGSAARTVRFVHQRFPNASKRAVAVEAASLNGELAVDALEHHLADPSRVVVARALRAAGRLRELPLALQDRLVPFLFSGDQELVLEASRALLLHGRPEPYRELQYGSLEESLGLHLLQFLVWCGREEDVPRIERFFHGRDPSGEQLKLVGRFGHPAMWSFLTFFLSDEDLQDDAVEALWYLLGSGVPEDDQIQPTAWEAQLARVAPQPNTRYRLGRPFATTSPLLEYQERRGSYASLEASLEEVAIRAGTRADIALHGWVADCEARLQTTLAELQENARLIRVGTWDCRAWTVAG